jgi:hypothetical protein
MELAHRPPSRATRGEALIVAHCDRIDRLTRAADSTARTRLELELGDDLARFLVDALAGGDPPRALLVAN